MKRMIREDTIDLDHLVLLCSRSLRLYDRRLIDHGERVTMIASNILDVWERRDSVDRQTMLLLCLFHDIGAYKTEEIDRMLEFESNRVHEHSTYGYLFLKYFSPLESVSEALLYHHMSAKVSREMNFPLRDYSNLIHLADRMDVAVATGMGKEELIALLEENSEEQFDMTQVRSLTGLLRETALYEDIRDNHFHECVLAQLHRCRITADEAMAYLKMLVFTVDFHSPDTVGHSVTTTITSLYLAEQNHLPDVQMDRIFFAALVHDIGKIAIPTEILENPGKLSFEQMEIMKGHVSYTEELLTGLVSTDVLQIASRHHEKLDGSGYPHGVPGDALSTCERIVGVADIFSALTGKRSYKDRFDREKTIGILREMARDGKIDRTLVEQISAGYDELMRRITEAVQPMMETYRSLHADFEYVMAHLPDEQ
jgi:HD-GYP domain-containing protein (c-di-GMP phosphodiesterase class II)